MYKAPSSGGRVFKIAVSTVSAPVYPRRRTLGVGQNKTLHLIRHAEGWHNSDELEAPGTALGRNRMAQKAAHAVLWLNAACLWSRQRKEMIQ